MLLGMSQGKLGEALGLTFQQVQKYEHGVNRITAGMLYQLSRTLDVPISFFFDCYESADPSQLPPPSAYDGAGEGESQISRREARMLRLWRSAPDPVANEVLGLLTMIVQHNADLEEDEGDEGEGDDDDGEGARNGGSGDASRERSFSVKTDAGDEDGARRRRRRRRGAAWDPADIG